MGIYPVNEEQTMKKTEFLRKGNVIRTMGSPEPDKKFDSINAAKKASRQLQQKNGGLGCGVLSVVDLFPLARGAQ